MSLTSLGLFLDMFGVLLVALGGVGWRVDEGKMYPGSWITTTRIASWLEALGLNPYTVESNVHRLGWFSIFVGFGLQLIASL